MFETFPFPEGLTPDIPAVRYERDWRAAAIASAARRLDGLRNAWLNPDDLVDIRGEVVSGYPDRILAKDAASDELLRERTLTNLYNRRPQWLVDAHADLDAAVAAAYGWPTEISADDVLTNLLELNLARGAINVRAEAGRKARRARHPTPEEVRRAPQLKLPLTGRQNAEASPQSQTTNDCENRAPSAVVPRKPRRRAS